jgi:hypothetical protein
MIRATKTIKKILKTYLKNFIDKLKYVEDEYGHPELRIEQTIFRFWNYGLYWRYLLKRLLIQRQSNSSRNSLTCYISTIIPKTGIGHQLTCWNTALIFSLRYDFKFVHYPLNLFDGIDWDDFLGLGDGELNYVDVIKDVSVKTVNLPRIRRIDQKDIAGNSFFNKIINSEIDTVSAINNKNSADYKILFLLSSEHFAYDQTITSEILRDKYWRTRKKNPIEIPFPRGKLNIACHVRRGDIMKQGKDSPDLQNYKGRRLANEYFIKIIREIQKNLLNHTFNVHIFSQGNFSEFSEFQELENVIFHLDETPSTTFHGMVVADILILSPSSFSYKAGIISKGIKIAKHPWWHEIPENEEWIRSNEEGTFNIKPLIEKFF